MQLKYEHFDRYTLYSEYIIFSDIKLENFYNFFLFCYFCYSVISFAMVSITIFYYPKLSILSELSI